MFPLGSWSVDEKTKWLNELDQAPDEQEAQDVLHELMMTRCQGQSVACCFAQPDGARIAEPELFGPIIERAFGMGLSKLLVRCVGMCVAVC